MFHQYLCELHKTNANVKDTVVQKNVHQGHIKGEFIETGRL